MLQEMNGYRNVANTEQNVFFFFKKRINIYYLLKMDVTGDNYNE